MKSARNNRVLSACDRQECPSRSCFDLILRKDVVKNNAHAKTTVAAHNDANSFPLVTSASVVAPAKTVSG